MPPGKTAFTDSVHGPIEFDNEHIESFVILRSDTHPTYHLSVVVDDIDMAITHVVRGDDHISNTPKQVLLYHAFGKPAPAFAHVPLIMGPDKQRLSKRHGATSVTEYEKQGYIPEAMFNFLALLGWGTGSNDELFTREELIQRFNLEGISGGNAVFNTEKLDWFNHQHLLKLADEELIARLKVLGPGAWVLGPDARSSAILALLRPRCKKTNGFSRPAQTVLRRADHLRSGRSEETPVYARVRKDHLLALKDAYAAGGVERSRPRESAARVGRRKDREGRAADSRYTSRADRSYGESRTVRDAGAAWPRNAY